MLVTSYSVRTRMRVRARDQFPAAGLLAVVRIFLSFIPLCYANMNPILSGLTALNRMTLALSLPTDVLRFSIVLGLLPDDRKEPEYSIARGTIQASKPHLLGRRLLLATGSLTGARPSCPRGTLLGRRWRLVIQPRK